MRQRAGSEKPKGLEGLDWGQVDDAVGGGSKGAGDWARHAGPCDDWRGERGKARGGGGEWAGTGTGRRGPAGMQLCAARTLLHAHSLARAALPRPIPAPLLLVGLWVQLKHRLFYFDAWHPDGNTGHKVMAEFVAQLLLDAVATVKVGVGLGQLCMHLFAVGGPESMSVSSWLNCDPLQTPAIAPPDPATESFGFLPHMTSYVTHTTL